MAFFQSTFKPMNKESQYDQLVNQGIQSQKNILLKLVTVGGLDLRLVDGDHVLVKPLLAEVVDGCLDLVIVRRQNFQHLHRVATVTGFSQNTDLYIAFNFSLQNI